MHCIYLNDISSKKGGRHLKRKIDPSAPHYRKKGPRSLQSSFSTSSDDERFLAPPAVALGLIGGGGQAGLLQATSVSDGLFNDSFFNEGFEDLEEEDTTPKFKYGFTDSEFFAFIANLTALEYLLFTSVLDVTFFISLNVLEQQILSGLLIDLGVTLGNLVEQEAFQKARENEIAARDERNAFIRRQNALQDEIKALVEEVQALKNQRH